MASSEARARNSEPEPLAVPPFSEWKYTDAASAVAALIPTDFEERRAYAEDRHWRDGEGWVGPRPRLGAVNYQEALDAVRGQFAPYDGCGEGLNAIRDAFSSEAQIGAVPIEPLADGEEIPDALQRLADEAVGILTRLWDRVRLHEELKPAIRASAWAERAYLRWWIPPGRAIRSVNSDGTSEARLPRAGTFEDAADWLALSRPPSESAAIFIDEPTQARAAIYLDEIETLKRAVVAYAEGDETVWRTLYENDARDPQEMRLPTGGLLPIAEMRADNLLTPSVLATQKQLDYAESVVTRTVETAGFRERYISNAEPSGTWVPLALGEVPTGPTRELRGVTYQLKSERRTLGASVTTELVGLLTNTEDGKQVRATPSVESFEPTDPGFAIKVGEHARAKILRMMRQGHRAITSSAEASGFAYQQARAPFEKDLTHRKGAAEGMLRDLLTAALGLIEGLTEKQGYFTDHIRITVDMHVDAGPRSPEERGEDRQDVAAGLLSPETAISRGGVEDVEAELERIATSNRLALLKEAASVFGMLVMSTSEDAAVRALIAAGVDPEIANALKRRDADSQTDPEAQ